MGSYLGGFLGGAWARGLEKGGVVGRGIAIYPLYIFFGLAGLEGEKGVGVWEWEWEGSGKGSASVGFVASDRNTCCVGFVESDRNTYVDFPARLARM